MGIVFFIIIFFILVVVHEAGHFIVGRACGIGVREFFVGMGPKLLHFEKNSITYSLRLFPIGGACVFEGEDGIYDDDDTREKNGLPFPEAKVGARIATVLAGPVFNFILAFLFSLIIVGTVGSDPAIVGDLVEDGAAKEAGIEVGDRVIKIGKSKVNLFREISLEAMLTDGTPVKFEIERNGERQVITVLPKYSEKDGRYYFGIMSTGKYEKFNAPGVVKYSVYEVRYWINMVFKSLKMIFTGKAGVKDLSGPVGMANTVGTIYKESKPDGAFYVFINMVNFTVLLSANLGVMNLIPFPALDGGRIFILLIEVIRRKPIPPEKEGVFHMIGFALLILLMAVVMYQDILRIITG